MLSLPALQSRRLRELTLDAGVHPHAQPHLAAASGLVCAHGQVYVVADDEHHLAVFRDLDAPGSLHRIRSGDLPANNKARKRCKPDLETLLLLPPPWGAGGALLALGSGSQVNRCTGFIVELDRQGQLSPTVHAFDLAPLYEALMARLGGLNIEGAMIIADTLVLLNRGGRDGLPNAALHVPMATLRALAAGARTIDGSNPMQRFDLGMLDGVPLGFTDGAARADGSWVFCAAAEYSADSVADGPCCGSVVGQVSARGDRVAIQPLAGRAKVEGIALQPDGPSICMVTDADDPGQCAQLLHATLSDARD
jgi:hypothetical protein